METADRIDTVVHNDDSIGVDSKNWTSWRHDDLLAYLLTRFPKDESKAGVDISVCIQGTILNLNPGKSDILHNQLFTLQQQCEREKLSAEKQTALTKSLIAVSFKQAIAPNEEARKTILNRVKENSDNLKSMKLVKLSLIKEVSRMEDAIRVVRSDYGFTVIATEASESSTDKAHTEKQHKSLCHACGRTGHTGDSASCVYVHSKHPDANINSQIAWADSVKGKSWASKGYATLPPKTLDGSVYNFREAVIKFNKEHGKSLPIPK